MIERELREGSSSTEALGDALPTAPPSSADALTPRPDSSSEAPVAPESTARLRWVIDGVPAEEKLDAAQGLLLISPSSKGAVLASLILDVLDRAAAGGKRRVQASRQGVLVEMRFPKDWPSSPMSPSNVMGDGLSLGQAGAAVRELSPGQFEMRRALEVLGPRGTALLRDYPRRRRHLAAQRRRMESELVKFDDRLRSRRRAAGLCAISAAFALLATFVAVSLNVSSSLALAGAGAFLALGGIAAWEALGQRALVERRRQREARLTQATSESDTFDALATKLAKHFGHSDPWSAASRLQGVRLPGETSFVDPYDRADVQSTAQALARALSGDSESAVLGEIVWDENPVADDSPLGDGWPGEVATGVGHLRDVDNLKRVAKLLVRIQRRMHPSYPLVLWEPWRDEDPQQRAELLMSMSRLLRPRALIAIVSR